VARGQVEARRDLATRRKGKEGRKGHSPAVEPSEGGQAEWLGRETTSWLVGRDWGVGPRKERWESVQAAFDDDRRNRPPNGSDDGGHRSLGSQWQ